MGFHRGPKIITDKLLIHCDAANRKSYTSGSSLWIDLSRNNNSVNVRGGVTVVSKSFQLDGFDDHFHMDVFTNVPGSNMTVSAWIYPEPDAFAQSGHIVTLGRRPETVNGEFLFKLQSDNYLEFWDYNSGYGFQLNTENNTPLEANKWYNVVFVRNDLTGSFYVNGIIDGIVYASQSNSYTENDFAIGFNYRASSSYFEGSIANVTIHNKSLSGDEIEQNYNAVKSRFDLE